MNDPLPPRMWYDRLCHVAEQMNSEPEAIIERALRQMAHLSQLAPGPLSNLSRPRIDESAFEVLLDGGNLDAAAIGLISDLATCSVAYEQRTELYAVGVGLPALAIEVGLTAQTFARAVLTAWLQCFLTVYERYGETLIGIDAAIQHLSQSEQPLPPTEH